MNEEFENKDNQNQNPENSEVGEERTVVENSIENNINIDINIGTDGEKKIDIKKELFDWLETLALAFAFTTLIFAFLFRIVTVDGSSMVPTLQDGNKLVISDINYTPEYGDIIVAKRDGDDPVVKRVIATGGQTVDINFDTWEITVDGVLLDEPYINREDYYLGLRLQDYTFNNRNAYTYPHTVSDGCVFVLGDNRNNSLDSRAIDIGEIKRDHVLGHVLVRLWPLDKIGFPQNIGMNGTSAAAEIPENISEN